ncbi:hypothetical protein [Mariniflexile sp. AS56]|uniref:hypothetical protein n=1 Tax=Mariniflexile sp. AS56 TaxID=3063957 RepID=UPI0026EE3A16|nr:hypothetical protein [Mariniflexile sp. AS56]MDO7171934.1 hypothetical protein [Mariniflexile sp. AS56]
MGGEGAMMAAMNSLKNNRSLLTKRKDNSALEGSYSNIELKEFPKATAVQLENIKKRIQIKNRQNRIRQLVAVSVFLSVVIAFLIYIK